VEGVVVDARLRARRGARRRRVSRDRTPPCSRWTIPPPSSGRHWLPVRGHEVRLAALVSIAIFW